MNGVSNYRPIASASVLGKVLEKLSLSRLWDYMYLYTTDLQCGLKKRVTLLTLQYMQLEKIISY